MWLAFFLEGAVFWGRGLRRETRRNTAINVGGVHQERETHLRLICFCDVSPRDYLGATSSFLCRSFARGWHSFFQVVESL